MVKTPCRIAIRIGGRDGEDDQIGRVHVDVGMAVRVHNRLAERVHSAWVRVLDGVGVGRGRGDGANGDESEKLRWFHLVDGLFFML